MILQKITEHLSADQSARPSLASSNPSSFSPSPVLSAQPPSCHPDLLYSFVPPKHRRCHRLLHLCLAIRWM
uniref:Uncharacterized protein n=1 Tax=Arundo donax TaxID=35708 RepID=A0A0A9F8T1_ARUDO